MKCPNCDCELKVSLTYENGMPIEDNSVEVGLSIPEQIKKEVDEDYDKPIQFIKNDIVSLMGVAKKIKKDEDYSSTNKGEKEDG